MCSYQGCKNSVFYNKYIIKQHTFTLLNLITVINCSERVLRDGNEKKKQSIRGVYILGHQSHTDSHPDRFPIAMVSVRPRVSCVNFFFTNYLDNLNNLGM